MSYLKLFFFSFIVLNFHMPKVLADEVPSIYMTKGPESIDSIVSKLMTKYKVKYGNGKRIEDFKADLKNWNPHILTWDDIPSFTNIYVEYPYPVHLSHPYAESLERYKNYNVINADAENPIGTNKIALFGMYTASSGNFQESLINQTGDIKSTQNSPISLGLGTTIFIDKSNKMISSSAYWSSFKSSKLSGTGVTSSDLKTKAEIGFNLYYQQLITFGAVNIFGGIDYEKFSTFNTSAYIKGASLTLNENKITYGTIGVGKTFFFGDYKFLLKSSLSKSLSSQSTSSLNTDTFEGSRFLLFASLKGDTRFTYHILYKRHMLDGPTKLTIDRIGIGLGFVIF
jgi:hypothetical protein